MTEQIVVFDVLGPMYHYDEKGWVGGALGPLLERLEAHGYEMRTAVEEAAAEEHMLVNGVETPHIMPGFAETALYLRDQGVRPVVVSAGSNGALEYTMELAAKDYSDRRGNTINSADLVRPEDIISTVPIGSKKKAETWSEATARYGSADTLAVYEDTFANLMAAMEGLRAGRGYHITSTKEGLAQLCDDKRIFRGHMKEAQQDLVRLIEDVAR